MGFARVAWDYMSVAIPGPDAQVFRCIHGVAGVVAIEVGWNTTEVKIVSRTLSSGAVLQVCKSNAVGLVATLQEWWSVEPLIIARIIALEECALGEKREFGGCFPNNTNFVAILHVAANTWKIKNDGDICVTISREILRPMKSW